MRGFVPSRSALIKIQTIILIVFLLIATVDAVAFLYENNFFAQQSAQTTPTPTPGPPAPTATPPPAPMPASVKVSNLNVNPIEAWPNQTISATITVSNTGSENLTFSVPFSVNGQIVQYVPLQLNASASANVTGNFTEPSVGSYQLNAAGQSITVTVVPQGEHTINVILNQQGVPFTFGRG